MATNKLTNIVRIPSEGTYEYYRDDSFEEEEEEDFFATPSYSDESQTNEEKSIVTNTQTMELPSPNQISMVIILIRIQNITNLILPQKVN